MIVRPPALRASLAPLLVLLCVAAHSNAGAESLAAMSNDDLIEAFVYYPELTTDRTHEKRESTALRAKLRDLIAAPGFANVLLDDFWNTYMADQYADTYRSTWRKEIERLAQEMPHEQAVREWLDTWSTRNLIGLAWLRRLRDAATAGRDADAAQMIGSLGRALCNPLMERDRGSLIATTLGAFMDDTVASMTGSKTEGDPEPGGAVISSQAMRHAASVAALDVLLFHYGSGGPLALLRLPTSGPATWCGNCNDSVMQGSRVVLALAQHDRSAIVSASEALARLLLASSTPEVGREWLLVLLMRAAFDDEPVRFQSFSGLPSARMNPILANGSKATWCEETAHRLAPLVLTLIELDGWPPDLPAEYRECLMLIVSRELAAARRSLNRNVSSLHPETLHRLESGVWTDFPPDPHDLAVSLRRALAAFSAADRPNGEVLEQALRESTTDPREQASALYEMASASVVDPSQRNHAVARQYLDEAIQLAPPPSPDNRD